MNVITPNSTRDGGQTNLRSWNHSDSENEGPMSIEEIQHEKNIEEMSKFYGVKDQRKFISKKSFINQYDTS